MTGKELQLIFILKISYTINIFMAWNRFFPLFLFLNKPLFLDLSKGLNFWFRTSVRKHQGQVLLPRGGWPGAQDDSKASRGSSLNDKGLSKSTRVREALMDQVWQVHCAEACLRSGSESTCTGCRLVAAAQSCHGPHSTTRAWIRVLPCGVGTPAAASSTGSQRSSRPTGTSETDLLSEGWPGGH